MATCPHALVATSGIDVGLPAGQMGNSEVGHMNIGAGRILTQELPRIDAAVADGSIAQDPAAGKPDRGAAQSHRRRLPPARPDLAGRRAFAPGSCDRAGAPRRRRRRAGAHPRLPRRPRHAAAVGAGVHGKIPHRPRASRHGRSPPSAGAITAWTATSAGSGWRKPTTAIVDAKGAQAADPLTAIRASYAANVTDEFIVPAVMPGYSGMKDGDGLLVANFRADRVRQILGALLDPAFDGFARARADSSSPPPPA